MTHYFAEITHTNTHIHTNANSDRKNPKCAKELINKPLWIFTGKFNNSKDKGNILKFSNKKWQII